MLKYILGGIFAEDGDPATDYAIEAAEEYGVDLKNHKATNIRKIHLEEMDLILCATTSHKNMLIQMAPELKNKIYTLKEYTNKNETNLDIKDPWGYDIQTYRRCIAEIDNYLDKLITLIKS